MTASIERTAPVRAELRLATRWLHDATEVVSGDFVSSGSIERYGDVLAGFHGGWAPLERSVDAWHERYDVLDWPQRRRVDALEADLRALGRTPARPTGAGLVGRVSLARGLGWLYVLEGSTLGAATLAHRLDRQPDRSWPRQFLDSGARPLRRWPRYLQVLEASVVDDSDRADARRGAIEAFTLVHDALATVVPRSRAAARP